MSKLYPIAVRSDSLRVKPGISIHQTPNDSKVQTCLKANNLIIFSQFHTYYMMRKRTLWGLRATVYNLNILWILWGPLRRYGLFYGLERFLMTEMIINMENCFHVCLYGCHFHAEDGTAPYPSSIHLENRRYHDSPNRQVPMSAYFHTSFIMTTKET